MIERELKLHVPNGSREALEVELLRSGGSVIPLRARYFDTDDRQLARADIALRLRLEGKQWVQTIKAPGPDELSRLEFNHPRPGPELDLSVYRGTGLESTLRELGPSLRMRYETDVKRIALRMDTGSGVVELACDNGLIKADGLELPVHELELEQISGEAKNIFVLGQYWLEKYGLILDLRSKAERGDALARIAMERKAGKRPGTGKLTAPEARQLLKPRRAEHPRLDGAPAMAAIYRQSASECLSQIIRNACFLAGVDKHAGTSVLTIDYVHQLRVGIRRLRSCRRLFGKWIPIDDGACIQELKAFFKQLGNERDGDVVRLSVTPRLLEAGMPALDLPLTAGRSRRGATSRRLAAGSAFQACLLALLQELITEEDETRDGAPSGKPARKLARRLNKWLDRLCSDGEHFLTLSSETQHDQRKKVKRLRYCLDFTAPLFAEKRFKRVHDALTAAQQTLGDLNDLYVAQDYYVELAAEHPAALFALGWLAARQEQCRIEAQSAFVTLRKAGRLRTA
ncbi:CYTH and CHAD domain-containing protein [Alcaligenaceae bacterium]|nr:CYTH and CHAD domain-containing protein [Alcaligenaceae bacterium]